jgi:hypothetical protein
MTDTLPIWEILQQVKAKVAIVNTDIDSFQSVLETTPSLLKQQYMRQQVELLELAAYSDGYVFAKLLLNPGAYIMPSRSSSEVQSLSLRPLTMVIERWWSC